MAYVEIARTHVAGARKPGGFHPALQRQRPSLRTLAGTKVDHGAAHRSRIVGWDHGPSRAGLVAGTARPELAGDRGSVGVWRPQRICSGPLSLRFAAGSNSGHERADHCRGGSGSAADGFGAETGAAALSSPAAGPARAPVSKSHSSRKMLAGCTWAARYAGTALAIIPTHPSSNAMAVMVSGSVGLTP
jgi:hypothetical protein